MLSNVLIDLEFPDMKIYRFVRIFRFKVLSFYIGRKMIKNRPDSMTRKAHKPHFMSPYILKLCLFEKNVAGLFVLSL